MRESLSDRVVELEEQLAGTREGYEKVRAERDRETQTVEGLQRALEDIQKGEPAAGVRGRGWGC